jgi:hypothetical protein
VCILLGLTVGIVSGMEAVGLGVPGADELDKADPKVGAAAKG